MKPYLWMDDLHTIFTNEEYALLDDDLKDGVFPLFKGTKPLSKLKIKKIYDKAQKATVEGWRDGGSLTFQTQLVRLIEKEHNVL